MEVREREREQKKISLGRSNRLYMLCMCPLTSRFSCSLSFVACHETIIQHRPCMLWHGAKDPHIVMMMKSLRIRQMWKHIGIIRSFPDSLNPISLSLLSIVVHGEYWRGRKAKREKTGRTTQLAIATCSYHNELWDSHSRNRTRWVQRGAQWGGERDKRVMKRSRLSGA